MLDFTEKHKLFADFEVNRDPFWPHIARLVGGSALLHLVLALCVLFVPPVRNALSITAMFSDAGFVDREYARTHIGIGSENVEMITTEKFHYPEGYFATDQQPMPSPLPLPPAFRPNRTFQPGTAMAAPTPSPAPTDSPSPAIAASSPVTKPADAAAKQPPGPKVADEKAVEQAQKDLEAASKQTGIALAEEGEINKRPFKDLADYFIELKKQDKLDINQPFEIAIDSQLDNNGKVKDAKTTRTLGDPVLNDLAKRLVEAMNESGILFYLRKINEDNPGTKVVFTIKQDKDQFIATVESEVTSVASARKLSSGFAVLLELGARSREGKDEEILLKKTTVSPDGKKIIFNLTLPHQTVVDIIKKGTDTPLPSGSPS